MRLTIMMLSATLVLPAFAQTEMKTRIIDIEGLVIEGEIQRPEAYFILQRDESNILSTLTLDPLEEAEIKIENIALSKLFK